MRFTYWLEHSLGYGTYIIMCVCVHIKFECTFCYDC